MTRAQVAQMGSPPHTRGKGPTPRAASLAAGITPAHAGKSDAVLRVERCLGDHPRTRGEKAAGGTGSPLETGSPPHTRGKVNKRLDLLKHKGITPARAGKSDAVGRSPSAEGDHPRTRGEKAVCAVIPSGIIGSPPRMRGKAEGGRLCAAGAGITPAHAGKRRPRTCSL